MHGMATIDLPTPHSHEMQLLSSLNETDSIIIKEMHTHADFRISPSICPEKPDALRVPYSGMNQ